MTAPQAFIGNRHLRIAALRAMSANMATEYGIGGSFFDDETKPSVLPTPVSTWGGPYNSIAENGGFFMYPPEDDQQQNVMPWIAIESVDQTDVSIDDFRGKLVEFTLRIRARTSVNHSSGPIPSKDVARLQAESLVQCACYCAMKYAGSVARTLDPTNAFSIATGGFIGENAQYAEAAIAAIDGSNSTAFDAIGTMKMTMRLFEMGGSPGV